MISILIHECLLFVHQAIGQMGPSSSLKKLSDCSEHVSNAQLAKTSSGLFVPRGI